MSREVCGVCWCPYDEKTGKCACEPAPKEPVQEPYWYATPDGKYLSSNEVREWMDPKTKALHLEPPQWRKEELIPLYPAPPQRKGQRYEALLKTLVDSKYLTPPMMLADKQSYELGLFHGAAAEREACAKVCDRMEKESDGVECCKWPTPADCAAAIRERSNP